MPATTHFHGAGRTAEIDMFELLDQRRGQFMLRLSAENGIRESLPIRGTPQYAHTLLRGVAPHKLLLDKNENIDSKQVVHVLKYFIDLHPELDISEQPARARIVWLHRFAFSTPQTSRLIEGRGPVRFN
jgi:hypothetical protein